MKVGTDGVLLGAWASIERCQRILDVGTGTGLIALMLAQRSTAILDAIDIDSDACLQARENIAKSPFANRIQVYQTSLSEYMPDENIKYDLIVSNPPYVASMDILTLDSSVRDYEPLGALDGGEDGLMFYRAIVQHWTQILRPGGWLMFEVGEDQADAVMALMKDAKYTDVTALEDTAGIRRVVVGRI